MASNRGLAFGHLYIFLAVHGPIPSKVGRQWMQRLGFRKKVIDDAALLTGQPHGATVWSLAHFRWPAGLDRHAIAHARHMRAKAQASVFQQKVYRRVRTGDTAYGGRQKGGGVTEK